MKIRRNHKILGLLEAGDSTCAISKKFNMNYSGQKKKNLYQDKIEWRLQSCFLFKTEFTN